MIRVLHEYNAVKYEFGNYETKEEALGAIKEWIKTKSTLRGQRFLEGESYGWGFIDYGAANSRFYFKEF